MLQLPEALESRGLSARMLLQVHDELVFECPKDELIATAEITQTCMQEAYELCIPLKTDAKAGANWADMQPI